MKLISLSETTNFLSQAAPRAWVQRMLRWMLFDREIEAYADELTVRPYVSVSSFTIGLFSIAKEWSGLKMDEAIREKFPVEIAERLVGRQNDERVEDEPFLLNDPDEVGAIDPGFFMYASEIDWNNNSLRAEWIPGDASKDEFLFPREDLFWSNFEDPNYDFEFKGIKLDAARVELLLPSIEMKTFALSISDNHNTSRSIGRPPKWNWEGAMAHIVSIAQHPDGLPEGDGAQARIEDLMSSWFISETGNSPATSQIRKRASSIMTSIKKAKN